MPKVLLIGWDAADWKVIHPLLDSGELPHLESLINSGVMGNIATLQPMYSPMLWTSIATGKRPFKHGIHGFTEPDPAGGVRAITNLSRKTKAIWNIFHQQGMTSNVIGWWPSHPAEPIRGVMVSNHFQQSQGPRSAPWPLPPGTVSPADKSHHLAPLRVHPAEIPGEAIDYFIPLGREIDQNIDTHPGACARFIAEASSIHAAATALMQNEPWDFMAVYYDAIDHFSHKFMAYHPPRQKHIPERDFELYQHVIASAYRYHDLMLGTLLKLAGPDTTVILMSDHGFHPDHLRRRTLPAEPAGPALEHNPYGIFVMRGPGIRQDERIHGVSLLDIVPTLLTLYGLPIGQDMDGKALTQAFTTPPALRFIPSWDDVHGEAGTHPPTLQLDPVQSAATIAQLVALGYVEDPGEDKITAATHAARELNFNLAQSYIDARRWHDALPLLSSLHTQFPSEHRFLSLLALTYLQLRQPDVARPLVEALISSRNASREQARTDIAAWEQRFTASGLSLSAWEATLSSDERRTLRQLRYRATISPYHDLPLLIGLLLAEGAESEALAELETLSSIAQPNSYLLGAIADIYLRLGRYADAIEFFERTLASDPGDAAAHFGLARAHFALRAWESSADSALSAIGLLFFFPQAHFRLGLALEKMQQYPAAADAYRTCVHLVPRYAQAHFRLSRLYRLHLDNIALAARHLTLGREHRRAAERSSLLASALPASPSVAIHSPTTANVITLVSGLPRSGTSVMMQMLAAAGLPILTDQQRSADSDNPYGYYEDERVKALARDNSWLGEAEGKVLKIVTPLIPSLPPGYSYRVIFMERHLDEVLASQTTMIERLGRRPLPPAQLREAFEDQLRQTRALLHSRNIPTLFVDYRDLMAHPDSHAARIAAFLGQPLDTAAMAGAVDPNLGRHKHAS